MQEKIIKTLIVEDNPNDMLILEKLIKSLKHKDIRFISAATLTEAVDILKKENLDLIISDLTLPDSRGLETFRILHANSPKIPVILLTGMDDESIATQAVREGAQDYLIKGEINAQLLLRTAVYAIERNALIQERLKLINELTGALSKIKFLSGLLPICAGCKKIRNDKGYWEQVESYLKEHSDIEFTHGLCPDCIGRIYPEYIEENNKK